MNSCVNIFYLNFRQNCADFLFIFYWNCKVKSTSVDDFYCDILFVKFCKKRINKFWTCDSAACRCLNSFLFIFQFYLPKFNLFTLFLEFLSVHNITTQIDWQIRDKCFCNLKTSHFCLFVLSKQLGNDSHDVFCSRLCKFQSIG